MREGHRERQRNQCGRHHPVLTMCRCRQPQNSRQTRMSPPPGTRYLSCRLKINKLQPKLNKQRTRIDASLPMSSIGARSREITTADTQSRRGSAASSPPEGGLYPAYIRAKSQLTCIKPGRGPVTYRKVTSICSTNKHILSESEKKYKYTTRNSSKYSRAALEAAFFPFLSVSWYERQVD